MSERCLVSPQAAVRLSVTWASAPSPRVCGSVGLSESATGVCLGPAPRGLGV